MKIPRGDIYGVEAGNLVRVKGVVADIMPMMQLEYPCCSYDAYTHAHTHAHTQTHTHRFSSRAWGR